MGNETVPQVGGADAGRQEIHQVLQKDEAELFARIVEAYMSRRLGSLRHSPKAVNRDLTAVKDFLVYSRKPPWCWTEEDFDHWCEHLVRDRKLVSSSERTYQGAIRRFLDYLVSNLRFRNEIQRAYRITPVQICHEDNCIPHVSERELSRERPAISHDEINHVLAVFDREIVSAGRFGCKDFYPLMRDKAMFFTTYAGGLRASECLDLNVTSFSPNPKLPELGNYGFISVWGKGSRGSGPKHRYVPVTNIEFPPLMEWYLAKVRPRFLAKADPNEVALFLSERGRRMALSSFEARFQHVLMLAGLDGRGFSPHCLRHSSVSHEALRMSLEANRRKHGHVYAATTQGYTHIGDSHIDEEIRTMIENQLNQIRGKEKDHEGE